MSRRRLVSLFAALAAVGLATTACADQSAAIQLGDETYSEQAMLDELDAWAHNETLVPAGQATGEMGEGSYIQPFVGSIVQQRVIFMLYEKLFHDEGLKLTAADRQAGRQQLDAEFGADGSKQFPKSYIDDLTDTAAMFVKLQQELGQDELQSSLVDLAEKTDVELSSRFGTWNEDAFIAELQGAQNQGQQISAVEPPTAPQAAPGAADAATTADTADQGQGLPTG